MPFATLGQLRSNLLARLGMGGQGASGGANLALMNSYLINGQQQLYQLQDWKHLQDYLDVTTGVGQNLYDYPKTGTMDASIGCDQYRRILRLETQISGEFVKIHEGITTSMWSTMESQGQPQRFERYKQILVYPKASQAYTLRIWFVADLAPFAEDDDRCTIDDGMVFLHAIANAKAHYRQPDAQSYQSQLDNLLARIRGQSFTSDGVYRRGVEVAPMPKPAVVGRDV